MIVAQLSDIHADGSKEALDRLDNVLRWLKPLHADAIIVSGDLAEADHKKSYGEICERLQYMDTPFFLVPGNVDDPSDMRHAFGDQMRWPGEGKLNCSAPIGSELRLIGLDVTVRGAHHGDAAPVLHWLEAELNSGGPPVLIFQHQHPFSCGIDGKDRNICFNNEALARTINAANATVVGLTCGHVHRPMFARFAGLPATMAPSVARAIEFASMGKKRRSAIHPGCCCTMYKTGVWSAML